MAYTAEALRSGIKEFLETKLADALDVVEAEYAGTDPVTLDDPVTWHEGHNPEVLELESTAFPFVAVMVADRTPQRGGSTGQWGYQEFDAQAYIDYFVVADDIATVNKIVHRYAKAIVAVLQTERYIADHNQNNYEPGVKISEASRHPKTADADMFNPDDVDYIQAGRVIVFLEGSS
jgi:hypothetical protein